MSVLLNLHQKYFLLLPEMPVAAHSGVQSLSEHCDPREAAAQSVKGPRCKGLRTQDRDQCSKSVSLAIGEEGQLRGTLGRKILAESRAH